MEERLIEAENSRDLTELQSKFEGPLVLFLV